MIYIRLDGPAGRRLALAGSRGAVEYVETPAGRPFVIAYHCRRVVTASEPVPVGCLILPGRFCYPDPGPGAPALGRAWRAAGCDDRVIWAGLASLYETRWGGLGT